MAMNWTRPNLNKIPDVYITWWTLGSTQHLLDIKADKEISYKDENTNYIKVRRGGVLKYLYAEYHEDKKLLEFAYCTVSANSSTKHRWVKEQAYYMDTKKNWYTYDKKKKKLVLYATKDTIINRRTQNYGSTYDIVLDYEYVRNGKQLASAIVKQSHNGLGNYIRYSDRENYQRIPNEFKQMLGADSFYLKNGREIKVEYAWHFQEWYKSGATINSTTAPKSTNNKTKKMIQDIITIPLGKVDSDKYPIRDTDNPRKNPTSNFMYYEKVDDNYGVLRYFTRPCDYRWVDGRYQYVTDTTTTESWRYYFSYDGKKAICLTNLEGEPITKGIASVNSDWGDRSFFANPEDIKGEKKIGYLADIIDDYAELEGSGNYSSSSFARCILNMMRYPELEQLYKLGYRKAAVRIAGSRTAKADLKHIFEYTYNSSGVGKSLAAVSGLPRKMLKLYLDIYAKDRTDYYHGYGSDISMTSFRDYVAIYGLEPKDDLESYLKTIYKLARWNSSCIHDLLGMLNIPTQGNVGDYTYRSTGSIKFLNEEARLKVKKMIDKFTKLSKDDPSVLQMIADARMNYFRLHEHPEIDWNFDCRSDIVRVHDALTELYNAQCEEDRRRWNMEEEQRKKEDEERRRKLDEKRKQMNYEDDEYEIRLPKDGNEIIREGSIQRICIGGYVSSHSQGRTNLFFVRKKSEPEVPFYAIEVNNYNNVVQIHGYGNKWLGNNPEAIPSVIRFLRQNQFNCDGKILTCTAQGYGSNGNYCEMPTVDGKKGV